MLDEDYSATLMHALFFLGELRSERSLNVILEILRQDDYFYDFHFGNSIQEILPLTCYYVGRNQLPALLDFVKEPGLTMCFTAELLESVAMLALFEPERRQEVFEWYRGVINFYLEHISDSDYYDSDLSAMIITKLMDIRAVELLPEIKRLFDSETVDETYCGTYTEVEDFVNSHLEYPNRSHLLLNIYERYGEFY